MKSQLIALAAAALLAAAGASQAQDSSAPAPAAGSNGANAVRDACMADVMKLCPTVSDRDSFRQCIIDHYSDLSGGCKSAITAMRSQMQSGGGH